MSSGLDGRIAGLNSNDHVRQADSRTEPTTLALWRYALPFLTVGGSLVVTYFLQPYLLRDSLFFFSVLLNAWIGGRGPGLLAAFLSTASITLFLSPQGLLTTDYHNAFNFPAFLITCLLVGWWSARRRRTEHELQCAREELEDRVRQRTAELTQSNDQLRAEVAERTRLADALQEREELWRELTEQTNDFIRLHEPDGRSIYASPSVERLYGRQPTTVFEFASSENVEACRRWWEQALAGGTDRLVWCVRAAGGETRWLESSATLVQYHGRPHVLTICRDVTEQRQAEEALRESERKLKEAERIAHLGYWDRDVATGRISWSDENYRIFGLEPGHRPLTVAEVEELIHPADRPRWDTAFATAMEGGPRFELEYRVVRPDGEVRVVFSQAEVIYDGNGHSRRFFGATYDITERKRAEEALRANQQLLQSVLATLPVGVAVTDLAGDILLVNAAFKRIWGEIIVSGRERRARSKGLWHESGQSIEPDNWASVRAVREGKTTLNELIDIETFDGQKKTIQNSAAPVRNAGGTIVGTVIVNEDVTERVRAQQALAESADRLQHLSRRLLEVQEEERRHIARELHDEFGQLLAAIGLHLHAVRRQVGETVQSRLDECAALLRRGADQVRGLALQLRPAVLETAGLDSALRWLADQHQRQTGVPTHIEGYAGDLSGELAVACFRVAQEALTNIVRHSRARNVWIELAQDEDVLELVVRDDGDGFDVVGTLGRARASGSLGLLGMQERVELFGGYLDVDSAPGRGTRIRATFPITAAAPVLASSEE